MRALEIREPFGIDALAFVERPEPVPGAGEVLIRMRALSLNYRDLLIVDGVGRWRVAQPRVPVSDGVGIVAATGDGVTRVNTGDRVATIFYPRWIDGGPAAEKMGGALGGAMTDGMYAEVGGVRPVVDRVFPFADAREAFRHLASRKHFGKVCVQL